jgi:hypothetical protein
MVAVAASMMLKAPEKLPTTKEGLFGMPVKEQV